MNRRAVALWGASLVVLIAVSTPLLPALFGDQSVLSFDTRLPGIAPFQVEAPPGLADRPRNLITSDLNGWILPETELFVRETKAGRVPLWNPYVFAGQPLLANLAYASFYPLSWLALVMDPLRAIAWGVMLHLWFAGVFSYLYLRRIGASALPGMLGALAVALSSWLAVRVHLPMTLYTAAWLPVLLYASELLRERVTRRRVAGFGLAVGMTFLAGFPQIAVLVSIGVAVYLLARWPGARDRRMIPAAALAVTLGGVLSAVQMWPASELYGESIREAFVDPTRNAQRALEPVSLVGLVLPRFFGSPVFPESVTDHAHEYLPHRLLLDDDIQENAVENALWPGGVALVLAVIGFWTALRRRRGHEREVLSADFAGASRALALMIAVGLLLALRTPLLPWLHEMCAPLASGNPKRALVLVTLPIGLMAGVGAHRLAAVGAHTWNRAAVLAAGLAVVLFATSLVTAIVSPETLLRWIGDPSLTDAQASSFLSFTSSETWPRAAVLAGLALLFLIGRSGRVNAALLGAAALVVFELSPFSARFNPLQELEGQYPRTPAIEKLVSSQERSVRYGDDAHRVAAALLGPMFPYRSLDGGEPMVLARTGELLETIEPGRFDRDDPRVARAFVDPASLTHPLFLRSATPLVVTNQPIEGVPGLELEYAGEAEGLGIYRQTLALPRIRLASDYLVIPDKEERLRRLCATDVDPARVVIVEEAPFRDGDAGGSPDRPPPSASVTIVREVPGRVEIEVGALERPAVLVLADSYDDGWTVEVDPPLASAPTTKVLAVDHAFCGVALPAGPARRVVFDYSPREFRYGALLSFAALVLLGWMLWRSPRALSEDGARPDAATL